MIKETGLINGFYCGIIYFTDIAERETMREFIAKSEAKQRQSDEQLMKETLEEHLEKIENTERDIQGNQATKK